MSTTIQPPLSSAELTASRRYCGYPAFGSGQTGFESWRFFQSNGVLEYRLANLNNDELLAARNFIAQLQSLEAALIGTSANLDTEAASVWKHNASELRDRQALYTRWRLEFLFFLGLPPGPGLVPQTRIEV